MLTAVIHHLATLPGMRECLGELSGNRYYAITGANPALYAAIARLVQLSCKKPLLIITPGPEEANRWYTNLQTLCGDAVSLFSAHTWQEEELLPNLSVNLERMETLSGLISGEKRIIVTSSLAVIQAVPSPAQFKACSLVLKPGQEYEMLTLMRTMHEFGYERTEMVEFRGEFSARGGIIDIFPVTADYPVRIEMFGDEIASIRTFEIHTQRSQFGKKLDTLVISAASETNISKKATQATAASLLEYFPEDPVVVWHEFRQILQDVHRWEEENILPEIIRHPEVRFSDLRMRTKALPGLFMQELEMDVPEAYISHTLHLVCRPLSLTPAAGRMFVNENAKPYQYNLRAFADQITEWHAQEYSITVVCATDADKTRLEELLDRECDISSERYTALTALLSDGWILPDCRQAVVTDDEIFHRTYTRRRRLRRVRKGKTVPIENIATITEGEYVVHINHGIGKFEGIRYVEIEGQQREMIVVRYADDALLYVPLGHAHLIEQYISVGQNEPELDSLGSGRWAARRRKAEKAVLDMAAELLERQAQREALEGYAYAPDTEWQLAFEKAFPYAETADQDRAINEVKQDMETPRPMDRLICGDVGFGKTEVALRAAFKAVMDGKQVAILVPTTILAQQHWHTFSERMAEYPVRVEMVSRFVSPKTQKAILQAVSQKHVDVIIGTHRLLSRDVSIPNLGLIIVDEEQRFGVRHKEKLKVLRSLADVLTLSATPIPRTLYQSLTGARDMSTIFTPPEERIPVKTLLIKNDYRIIREAILREITRGGQVFFLHNRVETINSVCEKLKELVPHARFAIGHGQMDEKELSTTIEDFINHSYDILVCTMIIESGVDMPNVNTIIVDNAHTFGLADLYQLRGRVGRSNRQAYAYLVVPSHLTLDSVARHRLKAILENTALGSGYAIAMKDLEIRGAGNLLGAEQSGHIASIGFGLYCKLLQRAVQLLKSGRLQDILAKVRKKEQDQEQKKYDWRKEIPEWKPAQRNIELHLPFAGNIPEDYIASAALRLDLFRRIGAAQKVGVIRNIEEEIRDRFGAVPAETALELKIAEARILAHIRGIDSIEILDNKIILRRWGKIISPAGTFPRIDPAEPLRAMSMLISYLNQLKSLDVYMKDKPDKKN